jgi:hypothetical protein
MGICGVANNDLNIIAIFNNILSDLNGFKYLIIIKKQYIVQSDVAQLYTLASPAYI